MKQHPAHRIKLLIITLSALVIPFAMPGAWADVTVTPEMLEQQVKQYIQETTPLDEPDATLYVECVRLPFAPVKLGGENLQIFLEDNRPTPLTFRTIIQVTMSTEAETRQIGIPVRLEIEKPVWITKRYVRARETIGANDVMIQRKRLSHEFPYVLSTKERATAYTSRTNLSPGTVLDIRKLKRTPAVYRNDDVHLILQVGEGVNVSVYGKALEDGIIGDRIRVRQRMPDNKSRIYMAEVVGKNLVRVQL